MLLPAGPEARFPQAVRYGDAARLVRVVLGHVVVFALEGFAGGILAGARDDPDAGRRLDDPAEVALAQVLLLLSRQVVQDRRQRV